MIELSMVPVMKVLTMCALGKLLAHPRISIITPAATRLLSKLVFALFLPCLIFTELGESMTLGNMLTWWFIPVNVLLSYFVGCVAGVVVALVCKPPARFFRFTMVMTGIGNAGNLPLAIIGSMCHGQTHPFGKKCNQARVAYVAFSQWIAVIVIYTFVYHMLEPPEEYYELVSEDAEEGSVKGGDAILEAESMPPVTSAKWPDVKDATTEEMQTPLLARVFRLSKYFGEGTVGSPESYSLLAIWERLKANANWVGRESEVQKFNEKSTWKKHGLAMIPIIYCNLSASKSAMVSIFADGSIVLETPGVEIGQGLHTKVRQAASFGLSKLFPKGRGIDLSRFRVVQMDTISMANSGLTSNSTTSEGCCAAVRAACEILGKRLTPLYQQLEAAAPDGEVSWETLISKVHHRYSPKQFHYLNYAAAASEVEVNLLTGETQILAADIVFDCGKSLNPAVDLGQIEGAFVQGLGFFVTEGVETEDGRELADGTWDYKVPTVDTISKRFHVELFNSPALQEHVLSSKASGEAPFLLAGSVHSAIRKAILSARKERAKWSAGSKPTDHQEPGLNDFILDPPASMDRIKKLCGFDNVESYLASMASNVQDTKS